jgi:hypothetical protein
MVHWPNTPSGVVNSPNAEDYNIPRVTIAINVTDFEAGKPISFATELMTEQVPLTAKPVDILNIYGGATATTEVGGAYGAINNLNADNTYFYMYSQALQAASYFSQTGWVRTPRANTKVGGESITDMSAGSTWVGNPSINVERNYIHASGFNRTWTETSLRRVEQWRTSAETDGFVFFVSDEVGAISLNGVASLGPWNMYGAGGLEPGGYTLTSQTGANSESLYAPSANTRIMKYVLNGPFGTTSMESLNNAFAHDGIYSYAQTETITEQNPNAVILIKERNSLSNGHDHTLLVVDPTQRLAYAGEGQLFNNFGAIGSTLGTDDVTYPAKRKFRGNFMSIFINSAMYGSHFYDLLRDDCPEEFWVIRNTSAGTTPAATYSVNQID